MASSRFKSEGILQDGRLWPLWGGKNEEGGKERREWKKANFHGFSCIGRYSHSIPSKKFIFSRVLHVHHEVIRALCWWAVFTFLPDLTWSTSDGELNQTCSVLERHTVQDNRWKPSCGQTHTSATLWGGAPCPKLFWSLRYSLTPGSLSSMSWGQSW